MITFDVLENALNDYEASDKKQADWARLSNIAIEWCAQYRIKPEITYRNSITCTCLCGHEHVSHVDRPGLYLGGRHINDLRKEESPCQPR